MVDFSEFYSAFREQFTHMVKTSYEIISRAEAQVQLLNPSIMYSATIPDCVRKLRDAMDSGIANTRGTLLNGFASAIDSLMGVYELVFEKKVTTLTELKAALVANWKGYEKLQLLAKRAKHKYGRGDEIADHYACAIHRLYHSLIADKKTAHGGCTTYELHSARSFILQAKTMGATPDGRFAGEEISKNASPSIGADTKGITALISSVTSLDMSLANGGGCLDAMLHPSAVMGDDGTDAFLAVLRTYMAGGGASIHFNIMNADILRDAQANPEKYKNLQVRVCGWNVLFNNMSKEEQDAYIRRAETIA
jgi:formate C-acetyltransferase